MRASTIHAARRRELAEAHAVVQEGNRLEYKPVHLKPLTVEAFEPKVRTF